MFKDKKDIKIEELETTIKSLNRDNENIQHDNKLEVANLKNEHAIAIKEKDFELKHLKDKTVQELEKKVSDKDTRIGVLEKEVEMLGKIVDINADIIDIKDLVGSLIKKLPDVNLSNLTVNTTSKSE